MSETIRRVRTVFEADTSPMRQSLGRMGEDAMKASRQVSELQGMFKKLKVYVAGAVGVAAFRNLVNFNAGLESMQLSMGVLLQQGDKMRGVMTPFNTSIGEAQEAMKLLREAAVNTPATTQQVAEAFNVIALRARAAGMSTRDLVNLSANVATIDMMSGGTGMVARDIDQLLRGQATAGTAQLVPIQRELAELGRAGQHAEALKRISAALALDEDVKRAFGASAEGMFATLEDQWNQFKEELGKPIMGVLVGGMKELLEWLKRNREVVRSIANALGAGVGGALRAAGALVKTLAALFENDVVRGIAAAAAALKLLPMVLNALQAHPVIAALSLGLGAASLLNEVTGGDTMMATALAFKEKEAFESAKRAYESMTGSMEKAADLEGPLREIFVKRLGRDLMTQGKIMADAAEAAGVKIRAFGEELSGADWLKRMQRVWDRSGTAMTGDDFSSWERAMANEERAREASRAGLQSFADMMNRVSGVARLAGAGEPVFETDEWGNRFRKRGAMTLPLWSVTDDLALQAQKIEFTGPVRQDNRGSRITLNQRIDTNDPSRLAGASLVGAFVGAFARPLSGRVGLGAVPVPTGGD